MRSFIKTIAIFIILFIPFNSVFSLEKKGSVKNELFPGKQVRSIIDLNAKSYQTFKFQVPSDAYAVELILTGAQADLDLFVKYGKRIDNYDDVDFYGTTDSYNEKLLITRLSDPELYDGVYYVDVAYQRNTLPVVANRKITSIPFTLELKEKKAEIYSFLNSGQTVSAALKPNEGMAATFAFRVPEKTLFFRIDVSNTISDLDIMGTYQEKIVTRENSDFISETLLGKEFLVVENKDRTPLKAGVYYITVFDQVSGEYEEPFSITASFSKLPPARVAVIPEFSPPGDEFENALFSTVEVIGEAGKGSGCLISPDGYIVTNWHVIKNNSGTVSENIYIAMNISPNRPPEELFKAKLIDYREKSDLALLKVESGLYGQRIPRGRVFPYFPLGDSDSLKLGQPLSILGYPGVGGTGSRASISLTTGIVSGFEDSTENSYIKTDAEINSGNSGGAVIDVYYNLVGLPTVIIGEDSGQIGYITPVSSIPHEWYRYIR